jgi:hypothetical protein
MRFYDVLTKKEFNNGKELVRLWHKVGVIKVANNGRWFLQMFHQPETDFFVFEHEAKDGDLPDIQIGEEE